MKNVLSMAIFVLLVGCSSNNEKDSTIEQVQTNVKSYYQHDFLIVGVNKAEKEKNDYNNIDVELRKGIIFKGYKIPEKCLDIIKVGDMLTFNVEYESAGIMKSFKLSDYYESDTCFNKVKKLSD